jgi:hypothetical protein
MENQCRVYLCNRDDSIFAIVSPEDLAWANQWKWTTTWDKHKKKRYATRTTRTKDRPTPHKIYLHKQILSERMAEIPPSAKHTIGDHVDSNSLNNKRCNLEWVTPTENASRLRSKRWRHLPDTIADNDNHEQLKATA